MLILLSRILSPDTQQYNLISTMAMLIVLEAGWQVYLTKTALRLGAGVFDGLTPAWQQELVEAALWVPQNAIQFSKDVKRGCALWMAVPVSTACYGRGCVKYSMQP